MKCVLVLVKSGFLDFSFIIFLISINYQLRSWHYFYFNLCFLQKKFALHKHKHDNIFYDDSVKGSLFYLHWTSNEIRRQVKRTAQDIIFTTNLQHDQQAKL